MTPEQELIFLRASAPDRLAKHLGTRTRQARQLSGESQTAFAARAGIALRTFKRFEVDGQGSLETFLRVLKALERAQYLMLLFPQPVPRRMTVVDKVQAMATQKKTRSDVDF